MFQLLISPFHDPYLNLAIENAFLEEASEGDSKLFLYSNDPAVVLGRFQNPWLESNPSELGSIHLVRRQSGGGTVFHDRGNLNFSFICPQDEYDKTENLKIICKILEENSLNLFINDRHDLVVRHRDETYKVSGSAFRHKKNAAFHHGTLLINTDKTLLKRAITPAPGRSFVKAGGTSSHRSKVINLADLKPGLTIAEIQRTFIRYSETGKEILPQQEEFPWEELAASDAVRKESEQLKSEEWLLGKTPPFKQDISSALPESSASLIIEVKKGLISSAPNQLQGLVGIPYGSERTEEFLRDRIWGWSGPGFPQDKLFGRLLHIIR